MARNIGRGRDSNTQILDGEIFAREAKWPQSRATNLVPIYRIGTSLSLHIT